MLRIQKSMVVAMTLLTMAMVAAMSLLTMAMAMFLQEMWLLIISKSQQTIVVAAWMALSSL